MLRERERERKRERERERLSKKIHSDSNTGRQTEKNRQKR